jgi:hypothetical protein
MPESRLAQLATSPLLQNFAVTASQQAIRPVGNFIAPICEVPDLTFRYKVYSENNRFRVPATKRQPGSRATVIGFSASDASLTLEPNALDFPIPNADQLSDEGLQYSLMEAQSVLADASALALENEIVTLAQTAAITSPLSTQADFTDNATDPIAIIDNIILSVMKASKFYSALPSSSSSVTTPMSAIVSSSATAAPVKAAMWEPFRRPSATSATS